MSREDDNKQLVTRFMQDFGKGDVATILGYLTDDATWWVAGSIEGVSGSKSKQDFGAMLSGLSGLCEGGAISLTPKQFTVQGDRVAVETESYAKLLNGRVYNNDYHFVFVVRDNKIAAVKEYLDTEHTRHVFVDA